MGLEYLSEEALTEAYYEAKRLELDPAFIQILLEKIHIRNLLK